MEWENIPNVVLLKIYGCLNVSDRLSGSSTCGNWRRAVFQVPLIRQLNLVLNSGTNPEKIHFFIDTSFCKLESLTITVDPTLQYTLDLAHQILHKLQFSHRLHTLKIRFTDNSFVRNSFHPRNHDQDSIRQRAYIFRCLIGPLIELMRAKNCLQTFSCPLVNELSIMNGRLYEALAENGRHMYNVSSLFLASLRLSSPDILIHDNSLLRGHLLDPKIGIYQFATLQMLSIDHDALTDEVLQNIGMNNVVGGLKKLSIVAVSANGFVTNGGWSCFVNQNPECKIHLTLIGPELTMDHGSNLILRSMPITHFRALYCRGLRMSCLNSLIRWNENTLEHLELVNENTCWMETISEGVPEEEETEFLDPVIFAAWRCKNLRAIKMSYRYSGESLIGIARLRGPKLLELQVPKSQIMYGNMSQLSQEISKALGRPWKISEDTLRHQPTCDKILKRLMQSIEADEAPICSSSSTPDPAGPVVRHYAA